jgi:(p)ppGpp synthase/HD superfamily hydrolase
MGIWNQDDYIKAWNFAAIAHNGQLVPGTDIPYIYHIGLVAMEAMAAIAHTETISSPDLLVLCAVLHDSIEDTNATYDDIQKEFGSNVASGVQALSKNTALSSKEEQMKGSVERIKREPKEVWMVKLSDRITNLQPPPKHWDKEKIRRYKNEAIMILDELGGANSYLSERLKGKIEAYQ